MSFVSTAISGLGGFLGGIGAASQSLSKDILAFATGVRPLVELGTGIASAVRRPTTRAEFEEASLAGGTISDKLQQPTRPTGASAMPGGAPLATISTSLATQQAGLGGALAKFGPTAALALSELLGLTTLGGNGAPARAPRMPKLLQVPGTRPGSIITYVRAPQAIYRVSVRGPRRHHHHPR